MPFRTAFNAALLLTGVALVAAFGLATAAEASPAAETWAHRNMWIIAAVALAVLIFGLAVMVASGIATARQDRRQTGRR